MKGNESLKTWANSKRKQIELKQIGFNSIVSAKIAKVGNFPKLGDFWENGRCQRVSNHELAMLEKFRSISTIQAKDSLLGENRIENRRIGPLKG